MKNRENEAFTRQNTFKNMKRFKVEAVMNGNTIKVSPRWKWEADHATTYGQLVHVDGYNIGKPEYESLAVAMLETLLIPKKDDLLTRNDIKLKNPTRIDPETGTIYCGLFLNGVDISEYFGAFKLNERR